MVARRHRVELEFSMEEAAHLARVLIISAGLQPSRLDSVHMDIFRDVVHHADPHVRRRLDQAMKEQRDIRDETREYTRNCPKRGDLSGQQVAYIVQLLTQLRVAVTGHEATLNEETFRAWTTGLDFGDPDLVEDGYTAQAHYADELEALTTLREPPSSV